MGAEAADVVRVVARQDDGEAGPGGEHRRGEALHEPLGRGAVVLSGVEAAAARVLDDAPLGTAAVDELS